MSYLTFLPGTCCNGSPSTGENMSGDYIGWFDHNVTIPGHNSK